jgi:hypothetical protein
VLYFRAKPLPALYSFPYPSGRFFCRLLSTHPQSRSPERIRPSRWKMSAFPQLSFYKNVVAHLLRKVASTQPFPYSMPQFPQGRNPPHPLRQPIPDSFCFGQSLSLNPLIASRLHKHTCETIQPPHLRPLFQSSTPHPHTICTGCQSKPSPFPTSLE